MISDKLDPACPNCNHTLEMIDCSLYHCHHCQKEFFIFNPHQIIFKNVSEILKELK